MDDRKAIETVWQRAIDALARCDWETYAGLWVHEPYVQAIHPATASWWTGWSEVGARYRGIIAKRIPIRSVTSRMDIHVAGSGDMAWAAMESEVRTGKAGRRLAWQVVVFEKQQGQWRMALAFDAPRKPRK